MSYLVDTQALIWFIEGNTQLKPKARTIIEDPGIPIYSSIASIWEIGIKTSIGKLQLDKSLQDFVTQLHIDKIDIIGIHPPHIFELLSLPHSHKDPFDRIIIAQAIALDLKIITSDEAFKNYQVEVIW
ncbi:MAG TPA: type II toxin-antitoxin system VapC family toxin [Flavilitoribacter sp.]|nr:type II toxin-antitoxin system VapC family toxin [Flavilitoribacter sp.]